MKLFNNFFGGKFNSFGFIPPRQTFIIMMDLSRKSTRSRPVNIRAHTHLSAFQSLAKESSNGDMLLLLSCVIFSGLVRAENGTEVIFRRIPPDVEGREFFHNFITQFIKFTFVPKTAYFVYSDIKNPITYRIANKEGMLQILYNRYPGHRLEPAKMDYQGAFYFINQPIEETFKLVDGIQFDRVIIEIQNCSHLEHYFSVCIKYDVIYAVGLCESNEKLRAYTFHPFDGDTCLKPKKLILLAEINTQDESIKVYEKLRLIEYPNYKGCPIRIMVMYRPPAVLYGEDGLEGFDIFMLNNTLLRVNATLQYDIVHELITPNISLRADMYSNSQIIAGMLADFAVLYPGEEMIHCGGTTSITLAAPKMSRTVDATTSLNSIVSSFPKHTWYATLITLFLNILLFYVAENTPFSQSRLSFLKSLGLVNILVSAKFAVPRTLTNAARVQFSFWCFFVFFITSFFTACLKSKLTITDNGREIEDLYDVARNNLKIAITLRNYNTYLRSPIESIPQLKPLKDMIVVLDATSGISRYLTRLVHRKDIVVIEKKEILDYHMSSLDSFDMDRIHTSNKLTDRIATFIYARKQAPFLPTLRKKCMMLTENGMAMKVKDYYVRQSLTKIFLLRQKSEKWKKTEPLNMKDVCGAVLILFIGHATAAMVLLLELFVRYVQTDFRVILRLTRR